MCHLYTDGLKDILESADIVFQPGESVKEVLIKNDDELKQTYCICLEIVSSCSDNALTNPNNQANICIIDDESKWTVWILIFNCLA